MIARGMSADKIVQVLSGKPRKSPWWRGSDNRSEIKAVALAGVQPKCLPILDLLLVAHGSRSAEWGSRVLDFGRAVSEEIKKGGHFKAVRTAMLEASEPDIATAVGELEREGCDRIVAVPLFVAPTSHAHFDVPAALGIYSSPKTSATLAQEGMQPVRSKIPITLTQTISEGPFLAKYARDEVRRLSKSAKDEAIVILAHGDPEHLPLVERLVRRVTTYCCGEARISYGDWAFIGVGQEFLSHGVPAINAALDHKKRVLVVGLYVSSSAATIHQRVTAMQQREPAGGSGSSWPRGRAGFSPFRGKDVVLSDEPMISHPDFLRWVLDTAEAAASPQSAHALVSQAGPPGVGGPCSILQSNPSK